MAKPVKKDENEITANVISGMLLERETVKLRSSVSRVIHSNELAKGITKTQIIGGDSDDIGQDSPPAIIIEKENDQISKIIVKCPCGRHAELICQYEENS